jgi:hypothetical protein
LREQNEECSDLDRIYATVVLQAVEELGIDEFRIHPKGTGVVCTRKEGIPPHVVVAKYLGEIYPPYRYSTFRLCGCLFTGR